ncbi:AMP-binding protein [Pseudonocardia sp. H11422]|uniref:AMP-binding protein n=1 Tax=Pseudonocardia sp. H11422 TaxID=2835866 RepID=UPI0039778850
MTSAGTLLALDGADLRAELAGLSGAPLAPDELAGPRHPDDLAYVLFTSGSTGRPKGVLARTGRDGNHILLLRSSSPTANRTTDSIISEKPGYFWSCGHCSRSSLVGGDGGGHVAKRDRDQLDRG